MTYDIKPGALVESADYPIGAVERVEKHGEKLALFVRPARADYLFRIPESLVSSAGDGRVVLKMTLSEIEQSALASDPTLTGGYRIARIPVDAGPSNDEVLGRDPETPATFPSTG